MYTEYANQKTLITHIWISFMISFCFFFFAFVRLSVIIFQMCRKNIHLGMWQTFERRYLYLTVVQRTKRNQTNKKKLWWQLKLKTTDDIHHTWPNTTHTIQYPGSSELNCMELNWMSHHQEAQRRDENIGRKKKKREINFWIFRHAQYGGPHDFCFSYFFFFVLFFLSFFISIWIFKQIIFIILIFFIMIYKKGNEALYREAYKCINPPKWDRLCRPIFEKNHSYSPSRGTGTGTCIGQGTVTERQEDINFKWQLNNFKNCVCHISSVKYQQSTILIAKQQMSNNTNTYTLTLKEQKAKNNSEKWK